MALGLVPATEAFAGFGHPAVVIIALVISGLLCGLYYATATRYYGAKAGLHAIVRTLARELRGRGVTVNLVSPGMIATAEIRDLLTRTAERDGEAGSWEQVERWALQHRMPNLTERLPDIHADEGCYG